MNAIGAPAVDPLIGNLSHLDPQVRETAAEVLGDIGSSRPCIAVPKLAEALEDESEEVRSRAAEALGTVSQGESTAIPALSAALQDEDERVRRDAILALARIGSHAVDAVDALGGMFSDENRYVRGDCGSCLVSHRYAGSKGGFTSISDEDTVVPLDQPRQHALDDDIHYFSAIGREIT